MDKKALFRKETLERKQEMKNKKGELTSTQIITIVIAIMGFVIVLVALYMIFGGGFQTDREVCKLSVLTRATAPNLAQSYVPLKCKTEKICITDSSSGKCSEQFAGESNVEIVKLSGTEQAKATKIEEISANAMFDCWDMMGQGKLDLFNEAMGSQKATCVVCSRVAIDKSVSSSVINLVNVDDYMKNTQIPGQSLTYLQAFTDRGVNSYSNFNQAKMSELMAGQDIGEKTLTTSYYDAAYVFSQIKSTDFKNFFDTIGLIGGTAAVGTFVTPVVGTAATKLLLTPAGWVLTVIGLGAGGTYVAYNIYESQDAAAGYCGNFTSTKETAESGCSVVQAVPYKFQDINNICGNGIQGEL